MSKPWSPYRQIVIETYLSGPRGDHGSVRARPIPGEFYPTTMNVECSKDMRQRHPVGTKFRIYAKVTDKEGSPPFLYTHYSWPYDLIN